MGYKGTLYSWLLRYDCINVNPTFFFLVFRSISSTDWGFIRIFLFCKADLLRKTAREVHAHGTGTVHEYVVDLSSQEKVREVATLTLAECGKVDILVNNAGGKVQVKPLSQNQNSLNL